jgi:hypothetical protein
VSETVAGKTRERERERERERGVHACHEENKIGSWILMSKDGMRTEVIVLDRCGKLPKVLFSNLSSSLALPLGVLQSNVLVCGSSVVACLS